MRPVVAALVKAPRLKRGLTNAIPEIRISLNAGSLADLKASSPPHPWCLCHFQPVRCGQKTSRPVRAASKAARPALPVT